jgi:hypothetical protein
MPGIWFLRFFLTLFPPLIIAAMYLLHSAEGASRRSIASPLAAGILTASAAAIGLYISIGDLTREHRGNLNLYYSAREIASHVKPSSAGRPMILADHGMFPQLLQYMQFMCDADWYATDIFAPRIGGGFGLVGVFEKRNPNDNSPVELQRDRMDYIDSVRKGKNDADFVREAHRLMNRALDSGRRIYVILAPPEADAFRRRFITAEYEMVEVNRWAEPCNVTFPRPGERIRLAPPLWQDDILLPWRPELRAMFEIRRPSSNRSS